MHEKYLLPHRSSWQKIVATGDTAVQEMLNDNLEPDEIDYWPIDGFSGGEKIQSDFSYFEKGNFSFSDWAEKRKKQGKKTRVIEYFGGAYMFSDLTNVDSLTGFRLKDIDLVLVQTYEAGEITDTCVERLAILRSPKRSVIEGNVFNYKHRILLPEYDLAIVSPNAGLGLSVKRQDYSSELFLLQTFKKAYQKLTSDDGVLLLKPPLTFESLSKRLLENLQRVEGLGVEINTDDYSFSMLKTKDAPSRLTTDILFS